MKRWIAKTLFALGLAVTFFGCGQGELEKMENSAMADSTSNTYLSSSAAVENGQDSSRQFIRIAELKFKVESVIQSTYDIENITNRQGGFVTYTNLKSDIDNVTTTAVSADSSLETTYFTVTNSITLRVPNTKLDTTLRELSHNIEFLDYRVIKAEDVSLQMLSNELSQKRSKKNEERLSNAIDKNITKKKLNDITTAEEVLLNNQEQADKTKISQLSLKDQVQFSTIHLTIYQRQTVKRELISNNKNIEEFEPGFGTKVLASLKYGWNILASLLLFMAKFWGLFLIALIIYLTFKKYRHKLK